MTLPMPPRLMLTAALLALVLPGQSTAQQVTLNPTADAYVRSGTFAGNNFGTATSLPVKVSASPADDFNREIYLKFDLSGVTSVRTATLRLYGSSSAPEVVTTDLYSSSNTSWTETGLNWNNKPAPGPVMWATVAPQSTAAWHEWDITRYLQAEKTSGRNVVTLVLKNSAPTTTGSIAFNARENASNKPQLVITQAFPWSYYEAEAGVKHAGATLNTGTAWGDIAFEARGRKTVTLDSSSEYVQWQSGVVEASHAIVRYSIAEGATGTLGLYFSTNNGSSWTKKGDLSLTSVKLRESKTGVVPPDGIVRYFDDAILAIPNGNIPAGAWVRLKKETADSVAYVIDFLELEKAPAAATKPDSTWLDITASPYNAIPNDGLNDRTALTNAINDAAAGNKKVWIPAGTFDLMAGGGQTGSGILVNGGVEIRGAGMWHTVLRKNYAGDNARIFTFNANGAKLRNLKVIGSLSTLSGNGQNVVVRAQDNTSGHIVENVWTEYTSLYLGFNVSTTIIRGNRVRNTYKDAIHFARNSSNNLAEFNTIRNAGDDNVALVSYENTGMADNTVQYNVGECGWWGRGLTIIGGDGNIVRHNLLNDCAKAGVAAMLESFGGQQTQFTTDWVIERNTIVRCGNQVSNPVTGSVAIYAAQDFPFSGRMEHNLIVGQQHHAAKLTGYLGNDNGSAVVYYRYNAVTQPLGAGFNRYNQNLQAGSNVVSTPNTDL
jgi:hypothetical protein